MTEEINLVLEILKKVQVDISELKKMRGEMREGFVAIRTHMQAYQRDHIFFENRLMAIETDIDRIKTRLNLSAD